MTTKVDEFSQKIKYFLFALKTSPSKLRPQNFALKTPHDATSVNLQYTFDLL
jgi:hypothetical protein